MSAHQTVGLECDLLVPGVLGRKKLSWILFKKSEEKGEKKDHQEMIPFIDF